MTNLDAILNKVDDGAGLEQPSSKVPLANRDLHMRSKN